MTTQQYPNPPKQLGVQYISESDYLTPSSLLDQPIKRNLPPRPGPRIQTMPSKEAVGIYSYLDEDLIDEEYFLQTLEAIESGEFNKVPEEIINWYNSIPQDNSESHQSHQGKRYYCSNNFELKDPSHEYIDIDKEKSSSPTEKGEGSPDSIKRPKRFQKGERMDFLKKRLSQFLTNNFKGIKLPTKKEESKSSDMRSYSTSDWNEGDNIRGLVCSNSFDNSTDSSDYIENPMKRMSTEVFISQLPPIFPAPGRETFRSFLCSDESNPKGKLTRAYSKSLENIVTSSQKDFAPPRPSHGNEHDDTDHYLVPAHLPIPSPPPRVSSRHKDVLWNTNLTQEYIEPRAVIRKPNPRPNPPKTYRTKPFASESESKDLYILPKDTPPTPMPRFTNNSSVCSIPILSPANNYSDPLDFSLTHTPESRKKEAKPPVLPKPFHPQFPPKPVPAPKPKGLPNRKQVSPKFIQQISPGLHCQNSPHEFRNSN